MRLASKVPATTVRGYVYKITIPVTKSKADIKNNVPRRAGAEYYTLGLTRPGMQV